MSAPHIDQETARQLLSYDPETGVFIWRPRNGSPRWNGRYAGKVAGHARTNSAGRKEYILRIFAWPFLAHRVAYLYMVGEWPPHDIDHIDHDTLNNRWGNLRAATRAQNLANTRKLGTNTTGFKGVALTKEGNYRAYIRVGGKQRHLGRFETAVEAHGAYCAAAVEKSGEFARTE